MMRKDKIYEGLLYIMRYYYSYMLDIYLTMYQDNVRHVPNIQKIDTIAKLLDGKHPDQFSDPRSRHKYGLFLAKSSKDPMTNAMISRDSTKLTEIIDIPYHFQIP